MKILSRTLFAAALLSTATGCEKFLDVNKNPNAFTPESVTPDVVLAQALNTTASLYTGGVGGGQNFNSYSSWAGGYWTKTNTINGYAEEQSYVYTTSFYANLFNLTYDNLNDYNIIQINGATAYPNHAAIARIMKAYNYLLLVDQYGDIPYSQALLGAANVTPSYDKAQDIYKDLLVQLTKAQADITATPSNARTVGAEDVVFGGNMTRWKQFANSLKLRILLRESQTANSAIDADVRTQLQALQGSSDGFITTDVVVQPGYSQNLNQQNPLYNRYAYTQAGVAATERNYQVPTQFILDQYKNNNDPRLSQLYTQGSALVGGTATPGYIGGILGEGNPPAASGTATANTRVASRFRGQETSSPGSATPGGIFKGFNQATPLMLLSEQLFNKAEAETRGLYTGGDAAAKIDFNNGVLASFLYFYRTAATAPAAIPTNLTTSTLAGVSQYNTFIATTATGGSNAANPLVNFGVAATNGALGKQTIIIYQKYLAMNSIASTEAWDDFRRTGIPKIPVPVPAANGIAKRLLYPQSEFSTNAKNVPVGVDQFTKIFWDVVD